MIATSSLATILSLSLNRDYSLSLTLNVLVVIATLVICGLYVWIRWYMQSRGPSFEIDKAEVGIGSHKISFKPNIRDKEIAYKIWVELSTRKIGLPIDLEHDVISEVYDSWYNFFSVTRELIKDIPVNKISRSSTREIITLSIEVLNDGLRPHLTTWQARFRRWYDRQLDSSADDIDPQAIQSKYSRFKELKEDMIRVNKNLMKYREKMRELVLGLPDNKDERVDSPPEKPSL